MKNISFRLLDRVERIGNRLPDPLTLFVIFSILVILISWLASMAGLSAVHPGTGDTVRAQNLLSQENIRRILTEGVKNFIQFPPLGTVLVVMLGIGVAERSGLIAAALKGLVSVVPKSLLTATLVFGGVMSNLAADAGYVVLTPLGAVLFAGFGRHPIAGLAAAFAGVSGGFSANLLLTALDPLLSGLSTQAAQIVDPSYVVLPTANYYFLIASTLLITLIGTFVTNRIVEPRLGKWTPPAGLESLDTSFGALSSAEKRGLLVAGLTFMGFALLVFFMVFPEGAMLRDENGIKPFYDSLVMLLMLLFMLSGLSYGLFAKTIRSDKDVAQMTSDTMGSMGGYIVLAFVAAQFVAYFTWSNLGAILAVTGASTLQAIGLTGVPLILAFILASGLINVFIGSASAKWAIMAPVFVPMLMLMGYSPELTQMAYRIGDSVTNVITPLLPYFPIIVAFSRKYDPKAGLGTLISSMLPYSIAFALSWSLLLVIWFVFGIPLGPEAPLGYTK
jgi:aminobenzoyl-glutamate transport protein